MTRGAYVDNRGITWDTNATDYEGWRRNSMISAFCLDLNASNGFING